MVVPSPRHGACVTVWSWQHNQCHWASQCPSHHGLQNGHGHCSPRPALGLQLPHYAVGPRAYGAFSGPHFLSVLEGPAAAAGGLWAPTRHHSRLWVGTPVGTSVLCLPQPTLQLAQYLGQELFVDEARLPVSNLTSRNEAAGPGAQNPLAGASWEGSSPGFARKAREVFPGSPGHRGCCDHLPHARGCWTRR